MFGLMRHRNAVYWVAGCFSLLLSFWLAYQEAVINPDAICYVKSAAAMTEGLHYAMQLCGQAKWPFYSFLIFGIGKLTHLPYEIAAYSLNAIFSLMSVIVFIKIIEYINDNRKLLWLAAGLILLSHEFNAVRQYIIRDHGFWAFYLVSIYVLMHYFKKYEWRYALLWSGSLLTATLFRIEGAMFLFALPIICFFDNRSSFVKNGKKFFQLNILSLFLIAAVVLYLVLHPQKEIVRVTEVWFQLTHAIQIIFSHFNAMKIALAQNVLGQDGMAHAGVMLFLMMASWYLYSIITNVSWIYAALILYAWMKRLLVAPRYIHVIFWGYLIINLIITLGFLGEHNFLSKRYLIAMSLTLMLWAPFGLYNLVNHWHQHKKIMLCILVVILITALGGILDFGYSKEYIHQAGNWIKLNVPLNNTSFYTNDEQVLYYANYANNDFFTKSAHDSALNILENNQWKNYDVIALRITAHDLVAQSKLVNEISYPLVQTFSNKRGDQVRIYRRETK